METEGYFILFFVKANDTVDAMQGKVESEVVIWQP
jgi:hypothetical protein